LSFRIVVVYIIFFQLKGHRKVSSFLSSSFVFGKHVQSSYPYYSAPLPCFHELWRMLYLYRIITMEYQITNNVRKWIQRIKFIVQCH